MASAEHRFEPVDPEPRLEAVSDPEGPEREPYRSMGGDTIVYRRVTDDSTPENIIYDGNEMTTRLDPKWGAQGPIHRFGRGHAEGEIFEVETQGRGPESHRKIVKRYHMLRISPASGGSQRPPKDS